MCKVGIGVQCPTHKLDVKGTATEVGLGGVKLNWFNDKLFKLFKWYFKKLGANVTIYSNYDCNNPASILYVNGNVGIGV